MVFKYLVLSFILCRSPANWLTHIITDCLTNEILMLSCGPLLPKTVSINADCLSFLLLWVQIKHGARFFLRTFMLNQSS